jgi:hypothetical protein
MIIKGYKFLTEQEAIDARESCDKYYGIPVTPQDVTQNWVEYYSTYFDDPVFWYMMGDDSLIPILGEPYEFEVTFPIDPI